MTTEVRPNVGAAREKVRRERLVELCCDRCGRHLASALPGAAAFCWACRRWSRSPGVRPHA